MGLLTRFIAVISCRSCSTVDEKALDKRNQLRQKLGKNKIVPQAQTDLDIKAEQIESTRKESPTSWDIFTVEEKKHEEVAVVTDEKVEPKSEDNVGDNVSTGGIEKVEDNVSTGEIDKAGGDAALYAFALNYVTTLVIPGAMERYRVEMDRDIHNASVASSGGFSDISAAVSDIVRTSLTNAEELLKKEQMINGCKEQE